MNLVCRYILLLLLLPLNSVAGTSLYQGTLVPSNSIEPPISIKVDFEEISGFCMGTAQVLMPSLVKGRASGNRVENQCNINLQLSNKASIQLDGLCYPDYFDGNYTMLDMAGTRSRGSFRMTALKSAATNRSSDPLLDREPQAPVRSLTTCITQENTCLRSCPQTDISASSQCIDLCKRQKALCLGKGSPSFGGDSDNKPRFKTYGNSYRSSDSSLDSYR